MDTALEGQVKNLPTQRETGRAGSDRSWAEVAPGIVLGVVGLAMVGFAVWGLWVAADVARPSGDPSFAAEERRLVAVKFFLTWLVLFAPFFCLGAAVLWSTFKKNYATPRFWGLVGTINQIKPLWCMQSRYGRLATQFQGYEMEKSLVTPPAGEPLDEETLRRVDRAGYITAKVLGLVVGSVLAGGGLVGFLLEWLDTQGPASNSLWYNLTTFRFAVAFMTLCALGAVAGVVILRDTLRPEERAWLAPLRMFGYIVGLRAVADILKREQDARARTLPGQERQKALGPGDPSRAKSL